MPPDKDDAAAEATPDTAVVAAEPDAAVVDAAAASEPDTTDLSDAEEFPDADKQTSFLNKGMEDADGLDNDLSEDEGAVVSAEIPPETTETKTEIETAGKDEKPVADAVEIPAAKVEAEPAASEKPAEAEAVKVAADAAKPAVDPATPEAGPEPSPEPSQEQPQMTQEEAGKYLAEVRDVAVGKLEQRYALSDEEVELLRDSPESMLPRFGARLFFDAVTQAVNAVNTQLPAAIANYLKSNQVESSAEDTFYESWPGLKESGGETVRRIGAAYRAQNPRASAEDFTRDVGAAAMVSLRIPLAGDGAPVPASGNGTIPVVEPVVEPVAQGFVPAGSGGGTAAQRPSVSENLITEVDRSMFEDVDELDAD